MTRKWLRILFISVCVILIGRGFWVRYQDAVETVPGDLDFAVSEEAAVRGLHFLHQQLSVPQSNVRPWIQAVGASVAVTDVNHDGFMDVYLTQARVGVPNRLFVNQKNGTFKEDAAAFGLADLNSSDISIRPIFFDCNNDGRVDLFLSSGTCPRILMQGERRFHTVQTFTKGCYLSEAVATLDINQDGFLDLITGGVNGDGMKFRTLPANFINARNGSDLDVFLNNGKCEFTATEGILDPKGKFFYHSIGVGDFRGTGQKDLWIATDFNSDKIFLNQGQKFELSTIETTNSRFGMNSEVLYLNGDETPHVFVSHTYKQGYMMGGNSLWRYDGEKFRDHAISAGVRKCGWAWSGRAIDLNNDGALDLAVANGYVSGNKKQDYWYSFSVLGATADFISSKAEFWPDMNGKNFSGFERDCLFVNRGGHFVDVAAAVGFDSDRLDGRAVAVIDAENKGAQDLLVVNQDARLYYYKVTPKKENSWVGFRLTSEKSSREALGAIVTVTAEGRKFRRELFSANSYAAQSDPRLHFGLGSIKSIQDVEIRWPSGYVAKLGPVDLNKYHEVNEGRDEIH